MNDSKKLFEIYIQFAFGMVVFDLIWAIISWSADPVRSACAVTCGSVIGWFFCAPSGIYRIIYLKFPRVIDFELRVELPSRWWRR